jgi:hypothetical protein
MLGVACMLPLLSNPRTVNAAEWSAQPSVRLSEGHDDNIGLTLQPHDSVRSSSFAPKLNMGASSDIWQLTAGAEAVRNRYSGADDLDTDERFFDMGMSYMSERNKWQVTATKSKGSSLSSRQISPDTGAVQSQIILDTQSISPSWTWAMNELTQLQLVYSLSNVSYVDGIRVGLYDYSTRNASVTLTNSLNLHDQVFITAGYSIFNVPKTALGQIGNEEFATTLKSKSSTYQAGITRIFSETTRGTLSAGLRKTSIEQDGFVLEGFFFGFPITTPATFFSKTSGAVFNGIYEKKFENNSLNISVSRSLDSSGTGAQVQYDSLSLGFSRSFTSQLAGSVSYINTKTSQDIGNFSSVDNRLYRIEPSLHWQWTPECSLDANYRYTHLRRIAEEKPVTANAVFLTLRYQWSKTAISR